ncbi:MAG: methyltransferase domain-containing protein [Lachnospiraceae bacterium]|nr:methyltransferase domain-containing protein [Lachnospiraceae bacterium]
MSEQKSNLKMGTYVFDGEKYKQASRHQKKGGLKLISEINIRGDESILDLGCGDGFLSDVLSKLVPDGKVIGIDSSESMIETAKKFEAFNLSFECNDINDINYENCFDIIYSNAALHWVKNHHRLLNNSFKGLKPNGKLVWSFAADGTCSNFLAAVDEVMNISMYQEFFVNYEWPWYMPDKNEYISLIERIGFKQFDVIYENVDGNEYRHFTDTEEMIKWLDQPTLVPFLSYLPDDKKEGFRNKVVDIMIDKTKQPDGKCFETFGRLKINAIK